MVTNARTQIIYNDINEISDILLDRLEKKGYKESNDTAHGRVIYELLWFKQEIDKLKINIPMKQNERASISYIYTNGDINDIEDADLLQHQLLVLLDNKMLLKPEHYPELIEKIKELLLILDDSPRQLTGDENKIISELNNVIPKLLSEEITPCKDFSRNAYPGLWFSCSLLRNVSTLDDIPKAGELIREIKESLVNGVLIEP